MSTPFVAPGGKEFLIRKEYREYMIDNFLSIKNKIDEEYPIVRKPGDLVGQLWVSYSSFYWNSTLVVRLHDGSTYACKICVLGCGRKQWQRRCVWACACVGELAVEVCVVCSS
jgi:hypothetical protein